jgi:hypothetical protein
MLKYISFLVLLTLSFARRNPFHSIVKSNKQSIKNLNSELKQVFEICKMHPDKSINPYYSYYYNTNNICPNTKCRSAFEKYNNNKNKFIVNKNNDFISFIIIIGFFIMIGLICR